MGRDRYSIGVDLGGTKIAVALVDAHGRIQKSLKRPTDVGGGPDAVTLQIIDSVRELVGRPGSNLTVDDAVVGVGIGVAGQIEAGSGVVHFAPNMDWHEVPLKANLEKALSLPVVVTNDVRAITWGEWLYGAGKGNDDLICMYVGTGIGGGVVTGGRMLIGNSNAAGEIGHISLDMHGPLCHCGNRGCLEVYAGGWAIAAQAQNIAKTHPEMAKLLLELVNRNWEDITTRTVAEGYYKGDLLASHLVNEAVEALVAGAVSLINTFNPGLFILGGGVIDGLPEIVQQVDERVRWRCLAAASTHLRVVTAVLGSEAGVVGAAALVAMEKRKS